MAVTKIGIYVYPDDHPEPRIEVIPDPADASNGNFLLFEVRVLRDDIDKVQLEFKERKLLRQEDGTLGKERTRGPNNSNSRKFDFTGRAKMKDGDPGVVYDKYTVRTFCGEAEEPHLDPKAIICR